jgi:tripartite-type tricarboxylate transporter receptor subunit TctC
MKRRAVKRRGLGRILRLLALAGCAALAMQASAQQYPSRPIRILVTIPPGGAPDLAARVVGERLEPLLGQPVVVENRTGAGGNIAGELVAKSPPDGYTLLLGPDSLITINPHVYRDMPFDTLKDIVPVASLVSNMFVLSVNPSLPVRDFKEFIEYARKANPPLLYASGGNGSQHQLTMEMLKQRAGINLTHVPYKGGSPATTATVAGEVAAMFAGTSTAPMIRAGKLRALAVTGVHRSAAFPDLPTIAEFYPGFETTIWLGLFAPAGTPEPVLALLRANVAKVLALPEVKQRLNRGGGLDPYASSPQEFEALIQRDYEKYGKIVRAIGTKID